MFCSCEPCESTGLAASRVPLLCALPDDVCFIGLAGLLQGGAGDMYANGSVASGEGEGESKRAQRLRRVYQHMRQVSLLDSDRAMLVRPARLPACLPACLPVC